MDLITFRCAACKQVLKINADKAGRKAKCKCGAELTIPLVSEDMAAAAAPKAAARSAAVVVDEDEEPGSYGLEALPEPEVEKPKEEPKDKKTGPAPQDEEEIERKRRRRAALRKAPLDPIVWERIRVAIVLVMVATYIWIASFLLQQVVVILGAFNGPAYATVADVPILIPPQPTPPVGEPLELDLTSFTIGLIVGPDSLDAGLWLLRIAQIFIVLQGLVAIAGYALCLIVPKRFGAHGLAIACLSLAGLNLILQIVFKLLPLTGAMDYVMIPLVAPEITMTMANVERLLPLHVYWSDAPFAEMFAALLIRMLYFAEPVLFCLFLRAAALNIRDDKLQSLANSMIVLALGIAFAVLSYYLLSITGTSSVMGWVMRVVYTVWACFFLGQLLWYARILQQSRGLIANKLAEEE